MTEPDICKPAALASVQQVVAIMVTGKVVDEWVVICSYFSINQLYNITVSNKYKYLYKLNVIAMFHRSLHRQTVVRGGLLRRVSPATDGAVLLYYRRYYYIIVFIDYYNI